MNFDLERMRKAVEGEKVRMPQDLARSQFKAWMAERNSIIQRLKKCPSLQ